MKICAISDTHGQHRNLKIEPADILCIAGDISPLRIQGRKSEMLNWLKEDFLPWCEELPVNKVFVVFGNHELAVSHMEEEVLNLVNLESKVTFLINSGVEYKGYKIWGSPLSNKFGNWAYMNPESEQVEIFKTMPDNVDILIVHGPPYNACDICLQHPYGNVNHLGNPALTIVIEQKKPKVTLCGHLHTGQRHEKLYGEYDVYNVSVLNEQYEIWREPLYLEI